MLDSIDNISKTSSRRSSNRKQTKQIDSEDISISQLELLANKKKLRKSTESNKVSSSEIISEKLRKSTESSSKTSLSETDSSIKYKNKKQNIERENQNDSIRREKSELLYKFSKMNIKQKWSSLHLDMNNSLEEIKNEYERVKNEMQSDRSVAFLKRMLLLGIQGVEMLNTKFDPLGVDLDGWSEAMGYSLENQEYDEVMAELYEKYKGAGQMSPEVKLIFMIISSATMFTVTKKITKLDSNNAFTNFIGNVLGNQKQQVPVQVKNQMPQNFQHVSPNMVNMNGNNYSSNFRGSETSEDMMPSKMSGPSNNFLGQHAGNQGDNVDLENILKTMNVRKQEKEMIKDESTDDIFKNIPLASQKKRGRPKKTIGVSKM
jgi:hypothetical protein